MIDWAHPYLLLLILPAGAVLAWTHARSTHPMSVGRARALLCLRAALVVLAILLLADPAIESKTEREAIVFVTDHSASQGATGMKAAADRAQRFLSRLPADTLAGFISTGEGSTVQRWPSTDRRLPTADPDLAANHGQQTDLASAVAIARGLFPAGASHRLVLLTDGLETRGDLESAARDAAVAGIRIDTVPIAGEQRPDVRAVDLRSNKSRSHEGAAIELSADIESSLAGTGTARLFENGIEVESRPLTVAVGQQQTLTFRRTPDQRNLYNYRVRVEGFPEDSIPINNEAMTLVDVRGRPLLLYVEGDPSESHYLADAMLKEGIRLQIHPPQSIPESLQELNGYDGIILSDVPAHQLTERQMALLRDYVEKLGGGFVMAGGVNSFGVGGYYRTPIEDILPVKIREPDQEEHMSSALALVIDRSGSMSGEKIELCKSAAVATVETLNKQDYVTVIAFDSAPTTIVPMTKIADGGSSISMRIAALNAGGGTNIYPGMVEAQNALNAVNAKVKHLIVLTDGQTEGSGYEALAVTMKGQGITTSTVGVGGDADMGLLSSIAAAGGGQTYANVDPAAITRVFTQDAAKHLGRLIREESFAPKLVEHNPMTQGWETSQVPPLLGYVKTSRKATSQIPLVTDLNDPLLASWRFGLGKVTAFTSDCKSRWASLWVAGWPGYSQFWGQILRETARETQSQNMDLRVEERGSEARLTVDLMTDAAQFKNDANVEAEVYFVPASALGSGLKSVAHVNLEQRASGRYAGTFHPDEAGVYLVRARAGAQTVSAGLVHDVSGEAATGRVNDALLEKVAALTGGAVLRDPAAPLPPARSAHARFVELVPYGLRLFLLLFMADVLVRRWENVLGFWERMTGLFPSLASLAPRRRRFPTR